jgi:hypothetical protein
VDRPAIHENRRVMHYIDILTICTEAYFGITISVDITDTHAGSARFPIRKVVGETRELRKGDRILTILSRKSITYAEDRNDCAHKGTSHEASGIHGIDSTITVTE